MNMFEQINNILTKWDPICIGLPIAQSEYTQYVTPIILLKDNQFELEKYLYKILDDLGLSYDKEDQFVKDDIHNLTIEIQAIGDNIID